MVKGMKEIIKKQTQEEFWKVLRKGLTPEKLEKVTDDELMTLAHGLQWADNVSGLPSILGYSITKVEYFEWIKEVVTKVRGEKH